MLANLVGPMDRMKRMQLIGCAMMEALEDQWPQFHRSVVGENVLLTAGTSIYVTGRTKDNGETIVATWDYGESFLKVMGRIGRVRKVLEELPPEVAAKLLSLDWTPDLPPPQALVSDVIGEGEENPDTSLFGCGGAAPVSLAVGIVTTHLVVDHRLHDPAHFVPLMVAYKKHLAILLQQVKKAA